MQFCEKQIEHDVVVFFIFAHLQFLAVHFLQFQTGADARNTKTKPQQKGYWTGSWGVYTVCVSHQIHVILTVCH
jgi:hypothetical protein